MCALTLCASLNALAINLTCHHPPCAYHMVNCERTICYSLQKLFYYLFLESEKQLIHSHALGAYALL